MKTESKHGSKETKEDEFAWPNEGESTGTELWSDTEPEEDCSDEEDLIDPVEAMSREYDKYLTSENYALIEKMREMQRKGITRAKRLTVSDERFDFDDQQYGPINDNWFEFYEVMNKRWKANKQKFESLLQNQILQSNVHPGYLRNWDEHYRYKAVLLADSVEENLNWEEIERLRPMYPSSQITRMGARSNGEKEGNFNDSSQRFHLQKTELRGIR